MIKKIDKYLNKYNKIVLYYDNGQEVLGKILDQAFIKFSGFEHRITFNHEEKRLFQLTDMLTYLDKYYYKYNHKKGFTKGEKFFFTEEEMRKIYNDLDKKRI